MVVQMCVKAFEDLDEIIARYIQPMAAYARDLLSYKYHVDSDGGRRDILDRLLIDDKRRQPSRFYDHQINFKAPISLYENTVATLKLTTVGIKA